MTDRAALLESVELENRSDLFAVACDFRQASALMKEANRLRASVFGKFDPNELRERTYEALLGKPVPLTEEIERQLRGLTADTVIDKANDRIDGPLTGVGK